MITVAAPAGGVTSGDGVMIGALCVGWATPRRENRPIV